METKSLFSRHWQAEVIRQRELHWGPVADETALRMAATCNDADDKLLTRAEHLCQQLKLSPELPRYHRLLTLALGLLALLAIISGVTLASSISPQHARTISLLDAMITLLLINTLLMLLWAVSISLRARPGGIGALLLHYAPALVRSPGLLAVMQAHTSLAVHQKLLRPTLSAVTHGFWLLLLTTTFITLVVRFIGFDYQFVWRTTLLSEANVLTLVRVLHTLPGLVAIEQPEVTFSATGDAVRQRAIAVWLLACLFFYAILPRALLFTISELCRRYRLAHLKIDWQLAGFSELRSQLNSPLSSVTDAKPSRIDVLPRNGGQPPSVPTSTEPAWVTLEWPCAAGPLALREQLSITSAEPVKALGNVSSREERQQLLTELARQPRRLLIAVNPDLTPDRGSLRFLAEASQHAPVALFIAVGERTQLWLDSLSKHLDLPLLNDPKEAETWLRTP